MVLSMGVYELRSLFHLCPWIRKCRLTSGGFMWSGHDFHGVCCHLASQVSKQAAFLCLAVPGDWAPAPLMSLVSSSICTVTAWGN